MGVIILQGRLKSDPEMKAEAAAAAEASMRQLSAEPQVTAESVYDATAADVALAKRKTSTRDERRAGGDPLTVFSVFSLTRAP